MNLNGGVIETPELMEWILNDYSDVEVFPYTWVGGRPGTNQDIFNDGVRLREGDNVLVPVFDYFCPNGPVPSVCPALYNLDNLNPPDTVVETEGEPGHLYYRIIGWGLFHVVCVYGDGPLGKEDPERCPFRLTSQENDGAGLPPELDNKTIEGYFVSGAHQGGSGGGGVDFGVFWYWLSR